MELKSRSTRFSLLALMALSLLLAPAVFAATVGIAPATCEADVQPISLRGENPTLVVDFGMQTGDFRCDGAECTGALREVGTDNEVQIEMRQCDLGDHCVSTEATSSNGNRVTLIHNYSKLADSTILQQEVHVSGARGTMTFYSLRMADASGRVSSASYSVNGKSVSLQDFAAAGREAATWGPIGSAYAITKRLADDLGFVIPVVTEGSYLSCVKDCVTDCGGTHNGGNCKTFRWSDGGSTKVYLCVQACGVGCSLAHPWSLIGCCIAGL